MYLSKSDPLDCYAKSCNFSTTSTSRSGKPPNDGGLLTHTSRLEKTDCVVDDLDVFMVQSIDYFRQLLTKFRILTLTLSILATAPYDIKPSLATHVPIWSDVRSF